MAGPNALNLWWKSDISASLFTWGVFQPLQPFCEFCCLRHRAVELVGSCHGTHGVHNLMRGFQSMSSFAGELEFWYLSPISHEEVKPELKIGCWFVLMSSPPCPSWSRRRRVFSSGKHFLLGFLPDQQRSSVEKTNLVTFENTQWKKGLKMQAITPGVPPGPATPIWHYQNESVAIIQMSVSLEFTREPGSQVDEVQGALNGRVFWSPERRPIRADAPYGDMKYCTWTKDQTIPKS